MTVLIIILQVLWAAIVLSCLIVSTIAAIRYARAEPKKRVLIADAPERGNVIQLHHFRRTGSGSTLIAPANSQSSSLDAG